jgi:hypothetical protein
VVFAIARLIGRVGDIGVVAVSVILAISVSVVAIAAALCIV